MTLKVTSALVNSVQGVPISVTGIAQVYIQCFFNSKFLYNYTLTGYLRRQNTNWREPTVHGYQIIFEVMGTTIGKQEKR